MAYKWGVYILTTYPSPGIPSSKYRSDSARQALLWRFSSSYFPQKHGGSNVDGSEIPPVAPVELGS